jgi:hypothetical protein
MKARMEERVSHAEVPAPSASCTTSHVAPPSTASARGVTKMKTRAKRA